MTTPTIDLNKVSFFKPVAGKTLREQLQGKTLAGPEVVEYMRSLNDAQDFVPPAHWEKPSGGSMSGGEGWVLGFSLTHLAPSHPHPDTEPCINGFNWTKDHVARHYRRFTGDPLDMMVGDGHNGTWCPQDWILIQSE